MVRGFDGVSVRPRRGGAGSLRGTVSCMLVAAGCFAMSAAPAAAMAPPQVIVGAPMVDGPPGPELPVQQDKGCLGTGVLPQSDLSRVPPPEQMLNLDKARTLSRGAGVTVAVLDTGVSPDARLPHLLGGGDYVTSGGNGLSDCDAHGTLVAGIIGAAADQADGFTGVAPDANILSIRYRSDAFSVRANGNFDQAQQLALQVRTLARAIVHAANMGAGVIVVSVPICMPAASGVDQSILAAAVGYASRARDAVIIAGAGTAGENGCDKNPDVDPSQPGDVRNWRDVQTISTPGCFSTDVVAVGFTTAAGVPVGNSMLGPWVSLGAPGTGIESLGPGGGALINGVASGSSLTPVGGSSFAAAYVAGAAALLRSRFPRENSQDIIDRLAASAHEPAWGVDDAIGVGVIDPVAALGYRTPPRAPAGVNQAARLTMPPPPRPADLRPGIATAAVIAAVLVLGAVVLGANRFRRRE